MKIVCLNWSVLNQHSFSDHSYISFSVSLPKSYLRKAKLGPNISKANWEKIQNILPYITPKIKLKNYSSFRDLDKVASSLQTSLTLALNLSAPPRRPPPRKVKPDWWDENIEELGRTSRRLFNNARTTKLDSSWEDYKVSVQSYKKR